MKHGKNDRIGSTLRAYRMRGNLSLTDVSNATGLDASLISRIETGAIADIKLRTMVKLASALGFRLADFAAEAGLLNTTGPEPTRRALPRLAFDEIVLEAEGIADQLRELRVRSKARP
jgi:transcriptional regulator with XRE-family HTH domain